jgi:copper chaperone CopZ
MSAEAVPGRIRFRNEALKVAEFAYAVRDSLLEVKGVAQVQINRRIGSILVLFDRTKVTAEGILTRIAESLGIDVEKVKNGASDVKKALTSREGRRYVKRGMLVSLATALGVLVVSERAHVAAGVVFVHLLALHLYQNKRTLLK